MPNYIRDFYPGVYCHIFNRGAAKKNIFREDEDYLFYLKRLRKLKDVYQIAVICYCLMPNHLHLLARQDSNASISRFIHALHTGYAMYFNKKYNTFGHLFENRFKQKNVENTAYLVYLSSYIHLNPLVDGFVKDLKEYKWSSYLDFVGERNGTLCEKDPIVWDCSSEEYKQIVAEQAKEKLISKEFQKQLDDFKVSPCDYRLNQADNHKG